MPPVTRETRSPGNRGFTKRPDPAITSPFLGKNYTFRRIVRDRVRHFGLRKIRCCQARRMSGDSQERPTKRVFTKIQPSSVRRNNKLPTLPLNWPLPFDQLTATSSSECHFVDRTVDTHPFVRPLLHHTRVRAIGRRHILLHRDP